MTTVQEIKNIVSNAIDANADRIEAIAHTVWRNPEPGFREVKTAKLAAETLRSLGLPVKEGLAVTGLRADLDSGREGPRFAILGEMDSLIIPEAAEADPESGAFHGCGHHTHITAMLGAAIGLTAPGVREALSGSVAFIGCPAEECVEMDYRLELLKSGKIGSVSGKPALIRAGVFDDVDMAAMIHNGYDFGAMDSNAFVLKRVRFIGKSSHAAIPHGGVNALSAANLALHAIALLRETFSHDPRCRVHGMITKGGDAVNVIPGDVRMEYQIRASSAKSLQKISAQFDQAMEGCTMAMGAQTEVETIIGDHAMTNDRDLYRLYLDIAQDVFGEDCEYRISPEPGSTDMGDVSAIMPAIHPFCTGAAGHCHGADFHIPDTRATCVKMAKTLALLAVELLYGNAEKGKIFAQRKKEHLTIEEYLKVQS